MYSTYAFLNSLRLHHFSYCRIRIMTIRPLKEVADGKQWIYFSLPNVEKFGLMYSMYCIIIYYGQWPIQLNCKFKVNE